MVVWKKEKISLTIVSEKRSEAWLTAASHLSVVSVSKSCIRTFHYLVGLPNPVLDRLLLIKYGPAKS